MSSPQSAMRTQRDPLPQNQNALAQGPVMAPPAFQLQASPIQMAPSPTTSFGGGTHKVVAGDNFWDISQKIYGNGKYYKNIVNANAKLTNNGTKLWPNMDLVIPKIDVPIGDALKDRKDRPSDLRDLAVALPQADYDAYLDGLSPEELEKNGNNLQGIDMMRSTGMTFDEMEKEQLTYMEGQATAAGKTIGEFIGGEIATRGYGGGAATEWLALTDAERVQYGKDFLANVEKIKKTAPQDVKDVITNAESKGGGFVWEPVDVEVNGALAYTNNDWKIYCGKAWVDAANADITTVYGNLVHEMGGHNEYGNDEQGWKIASSVINDLPAAEKAKALGGSNSPYSAYGYMETELWAELRENPYDSVNSPSDHPFDTAPAVGDVKENLQDIKKSFAPKIAEALIQSLWMRAKRDNRITADTRKKLAADIKDVFGLDVK